MERKKRIVVTGMGVVSCFGQNVDTFYQKLLNGTSGVQTITKFPIDDFSTKFAATVTDFDPSNYIDKKQARRVDEYIAYTMV
ncbi:MAG TPA: beta-ketoacyl synthase N-terminal-like domain-containing protein, partial [Chlamydiales bacterium]|nr:beta-ketoacyl synthase N-terminal-like domain-containing protein [Chlamydiales bacterium]